jgi:hypothetical protein
MRPPEDGVTTGEERELSIRTARKDGRRVVSLHSLERGDECIVECEVCPVSGLAGEPLRAGPYRFESPQAALRFVDDALDALAYLGCEVS